MPTNQAGSIVAPTIIDCPDDSGLDCHLIVVLTRGGKLIEQLVWPYPLVAIRVGARHLFWIDGITVANVCISDKNDLGGVASVPLNASVGDLRGAAVVDDMLLVMTGEGLFGISPGDATPRLVTAEREGWAITTDDVRYAAWVTGVAGSAEGSVKRLDLIDGAAVVISEGEAGPSTVALDGETVYWATLGSGGDGSIRRLGPGDVAPVTIAEGLSAPRSIAVDRQEVYFVTDAPDGRHLCKVPSQGGPVIDLLHRPGAPGSTGEERLVVNGNDIYFVVNGRLEHTLTDGAQTEPLVNVGVIVSLGVDASCIYLALKKPGLGPAPPRLRLR